MNGYEARRAAKAERHRQYAANAEARSNAAYEKSRKLADQIPFGQPILVGHHSEKHARRDADRIARGMDTFVEQRALSGKHAGIAAAVENGRAISSWDPDADEKLDERIAELEAKQERMKLINTTIRKAKPGTLDASLAAIGLTPDEKEDLIRAAKFSGSKGYPGYALSNNNGNLRRLKERKVTLARQRAAAPEGFIKVVPNKYAGKCCECGDPVEAYAGKYASDADGDAAVYCNPCMEAV